GYWKLNSNYLDETSNNNETSNQTQQNNTVIDENNTSSETPIVFNLETVENGQDAVLNISIAPTGTSAKGIPVLLYHTIVKENPVGSEITAENFKQQMSALHEEGFTTVSMQDMSAYVKGDKELPDKSILITFDDGRKDSYLNADPVLREHGYNAVMLLISKYATRTRTSASFSYMNKSLVEEMLNTGRWEIEAHAKDSHAYSVIDSDGKTGPFLTSKLWVANKSRIEYNGEYRSRINDELSAVQDDLENNFSVSINSFAYPYGQYGQKVTNYPEAKNVIDDLSHDYYEHVLYQTFSGEGYSYNFPDTNKFMVKRITVLPEWQARDVLNIIATGREKTIPY
ncbi:MAG: polysaccharide deacetylase family protein, partial [Nanoarchaeota archaeon]